MSGVGWARAWIQTAVVRWDLGPATHAALQLDLAFEPREATWVRVVPESLAGPARDGWETDRDAAAAN
eukprot:4416226-Lingulodinium_polyedra.AAC.1